MMNPKELQQKTVEELKKMAAELQVAIRDTRFKVSTRQNKKVHTLQVSKHDLARVLTALNAKHEPTSHV